MSEVLAFTFFSLWGILGALSGLAIPPNNYAPLPLEFFGETTPAVAGPLSEDSPMGCVYLVTCLATTDRYVGQTACSLAKRKGEHERLAKRGVNRPLYCAIRKYGKESFIWKVLFSDVADEDLYSVEQRMIELLHTRHPDGYNLTDRGPGAKGAKWGKDANRKKSVEHCNKIRAALIGRKRPAFSEEWKARIGLGSKRYFQCHPEVCLRRSLALLGNKRGLGRKILLEVRARMAESHLGLVQSEETKIKKAQTNSLLSVHLKRSDSARKLWSDPEYRSKNLAARLERKSRYE